MNKVFFFLILSMGIFSVIPLIDGVEYSQICIDKVWIEKTEGKIACVTATTADKLVERGWGTILSDDTFDEKPKMLESSQGEINYQKELSLLSEHDGGVGPLTVTPVIGETTKQYSEFYVPGTEELDENEMRIFACGTGSPWVMLGQAASCFLLQTADGHNLIFDLGGGSVGNLNTLGIPGNEMTHVFASHLHVDHIGDLPSFWGQAFMMGRSAPIELYGPSGPDEHLGTSAFVDGFMENWAWDLESKRGEAPKSVHQINVHEFEWSETQIVYENNGLTVTSFPAVHAIDGPVSYRIDWNDLSVIYSGDTTLNTFLLENSMNVDVLILQVSPSAEQMSRLFGFSPELATKLTSHVHIAPDAAGVAFNITQPRLPVIFHMNLFDTEIVPDAYTNIRKYYDEPVVIAQDRTVINVTPDYAVIRQAQVDPLTTPSFTPFGEIDEEKEYFFSDWLEESIVDVEQLKKEIDDQKLDIIITPQEAQSIAKEAYIFGYPMILMDLTAKKMSNVAEAREQTAPVNQFAHFSEFPSPDFTDVVKPNADTLYSSAWLDLSDEPIMLHVPDTDDRYYLMPMLDAYTNIFESPGKRTTGTEANDFAIVGPFWDGTLPDDIVKIQSPTELVWVIGRTQANGVADFDAVNEIQKQYTLTPLSSFGKSYTPPQTVTVDSEIDVITPPVTKIEQADVDIYFDRLAMLMKANPPSSDDAETVAKFAKIGLIPGEKYDSTNFDPKIITAIELGTKEGLAKIKTSIADVGTIENGWQIARDLGSYDTNYLLRASVAYMGLGANLPEDAIYPMAYVDSNGDLLNGNNKYVIHFSKDQHPPSNAFWSITMYDVAELFVENPINLYAIGDRNELEYNEDGSLDIYIQHEVPEEYDSNWLPAPEDDFNITMRMYWPQESVIDGTWNIPSVQKIE